jgi:transcriptional regulator with XRE-family HTH domain
MSTLDATLDACATCGELLKLLRRRARLSQHELSIAVGYSESHISRLENNERSLDRSALLALFAPTLHLQDEPAIFERLQALCTAAPTMPAAGSTSAAIAPPTPVARHGVATLPVQLSSFENRRFPLRRDHAKLAQQPHGIENHTILDQFTFFQGKDGAGADRGLLAGCRNAVEIAQMGGRRRTCGSPCRWVECPLTRHVVYRLPQGVSLHRTAA